MIDYKKFENDDFMAILDYLRYESLVDEYQVSETLDIDLETVNKYFRLAQSIVAEEIENGETTNYGADIALGFMVYLGKI